MPSNTLPLMPAVASMVSGSRRSGQSVPVDQAIGAAASLGLCLTVLGMVGSVYKSSKATQANEVDREEFEVDDCPSRGALSSYFRRWLRRMLLDDENRGDEIMIPAIDGAIITHQGSCHCESVSFEMIGPRCLSAEQMTGKIQYRHTEVKSHKFRIVRGGECLRTYYVSSRSSTNRGAHAFCERCGVHVLYAPGKNSSVLHINVNCVKPGIGRVRLVKKSKEAVDDRVGVPQQWDDQLSTISEVTQDTQLFHFHSQESSVSGGSSVFGPYVADNTPINAKPFPLRSRSTETPTTSESLSTIESQIPLVSLQRDARSQVSAMSLSGHEGDFLSESSPRPSNMSSDFSVSSAATTPSTMPEMRDNMKRFMKKHISSRSAIGALHTDPNSFVQQPVQQKNPAMYSV